MKNSVSLTLTLPAAMRLVAAVLALQLLVACSEAEVTELVFRKTLEFQLRSECDQVRPESIANETCKQAVSQQIKACMAGADWQQYVADQDNEIKQERFLMRFFPCFVDSSGQSYF